MPQYILTSEYVSFDKAPNILNPDILFHGEPQKKKLYSNCGSVGYTVRLQLILVGRSPGHFPSDISPAGTIPPRGVTFPRLLKF